MLEKGLLGLKDDSSSFALADYVSAVANLNVKKINGVVQKLDLFKIKNTLDIASLGVEDVVSKELILSEVIKNLFEGIKTSEISDLLVLSTSMFIEKDPAYDKVASKLQMMKLYKEVLKKSIKSNQELDFEYKKSFIDSIKSGIDIGILDSRLKFFDLERLAQAIVCERDSNLQFLGLNTLIPRYLLKINGKRAELPQGFWMRVAMGLSICEDDVNKRAIEFYNLLSNLFFVSSTPTLLHASLAKAQLSSCYLATVNDDLGHIFKSLGDIAFLSKWSGGVASDWTNLRATGSNIKSINVESQGVIPFLKIANDVTAAINRSGKRRSATVAYLEAWHLDFEDFTDLRKNTGDERRRAHDMNFASWIPDLFIKRVIANQEWTLFSPDDVSDLHHVYGQKFEERYVQYEQDVDSGKITRFKKVSAVALWRRIITRLFETGYPWITFKDPSNIRSPQDHVGVVHCSNLCTEITLNTSESETAVCNLGSVNLSKHIYNGKLDTELLENTISTAVRMLDNVVDLNYYPTIEAKNSNIKHRPIGLGLMGFQDAMYKLGINWNSQKAYEFSDELTEKFSYEAILASSKLAKEKGSYSTFKGSKWDRGMLPVDTLDLLEKERGMDVEISRSAKLDWAPVRDHIKLWGMRNSNVMAVAPTATISNIAGCFPSIEPIYTNLYVKSNMAGEFTVANSYLVEDLKKLNLWSQDMFEKIKYYDGSVQAIEEIPSEIREKYRGAFEIDPVWLIKLTAARSKWIDQSISHNVFARGITGAQLSDVYMTAWKMGMKTTYYLRTLGASQIEKSTLDASKYGFTQKREYSNLSNESKPQSSEAPESGSTCSISSDPECEVCQ